MPPPARPAYARILTLLPVLGALLFFALAPLGAGAQSLGPNLITNPSLESSSGGIPTGWKKGGYGTNTRTHIYPDSPGHTGTGAAGVSITAYTRGDAKWYFDNVPVAAGATYQFSDWYRSDVISEVDVQVTHADGSKSYIVLGHPVATAGYAKFVSTFTAPSGAVSVTVFHVVDRVGTLTVDDYSLNRVTEAGGNLVSNGTFEMPGADGVPLDWSRGSWGANTRTFTYPVASASGNGARVSIESYTSGDAKWVFDPVPVSSGVYRYANTYLANVPSILTVQFFHTNGSVSYRDIATLPTASSFRNVSQDFAVPAGVQALTVFHLIKQVGTLTIDNVSLTRSAAVGIFATGAVTLTFDDGWLSQYQNAVPKLNQYGFKGTFYITSRKLFDYGFLGYMSQTQIKDIYADGMEIGSHTRTHPDLTQLSSTEQQTEINGAKQDLLALNVGPVNSFAYPFGAYNDSVISIVKSAHTNARSSNGGFATPSSNPYLLERLLIQNTTTVGEATQKIDEAAANRVWLIIAFHHVDESGETTSITPANFNAVIDYLNQKGIPVVTIQQGIQSL